MRSRTDHDWDAESEAALWELRFRWLWSHADGFVAVNAGHVNLADSRFPSGAVLDDHTLDYIDKLIDLESPGAVENTERR